MIIFFLSFLLTTAFTTITPKTPQQIVDSIIVLLQSGSDHDYIGEPVSQLEHALQCAQLARNDTADEETIIAALLHDVGHLLKSDEQMGEYGVKYHEKLGAEYALSCGFSQKVASLIEGHVQAKRYLTYKNPDYFNKLSYASLQTLEFQGGPMTMQEAEAFEHDPLFEQKLQMRRWDEQAKRVGWEVTPLEEYREILLRNIVKEECMNLKNKLSECINAWQIYLNSFDHWELLTENITPKKSGCGIIYELGNPLNRANESFALADMRTIQFAEPHYHPEVEIYFILQGTGLLVIGGQEQQIKKGSIIIIPSNIAHFTIPDNDLVLAVVNTPPFNAAHYHPVTEDNKEVLFDKAQFDRLIEQQS